MLYQDPLDFPLLSVLDNFMLGQTDGLGSEKKKFSKNFSALAEALNFSLTPDAALKTLTIGERQQLEIIRLMALGIQVLILDEPTTGISSTQKEVLFDALKKLAVEPGHYRTPGPGGTVCVGSKFSQRPHSNRIAPAVPGFFHRHQQRPRSFGNPAALCHLGHHPKPANDRRSQYFIWSQRH